MLAGRLGGNPEIIFVGDSLTRDGWVWARRIGEWNLKTLNFGKDGIGTLEVQHFAKEAVKKNPKYLFIMSGRNDELDSKDKAEEVFAIYRETLELVRAAGITPIVQLTVYRVNETQKLAIDRLNELVTAYAREHQIKVIDLNPMLCPGGSLDPKYNRNNDGIHLNDDAYRIWAREIRNVLKDLRRGGS